MSDSNFDEIEAVKTELLPPEMLLDETHPANDKYLQSIESIKRYIVSHSAGMHYSHVQICKARHVGQSAAQIAEKVDVTPLTVNRALKSPPGEKLLALLHHLSLLMEGPRLQHRNNLLWRIAIKNEDRQPRVTIAALAEMNKSHHQQEALQSGHLNNNVVQIVINNDMFPRGALDE
jgi:hypothetical protein